MRPVPLTKEKPDVGCLKVGVEYNEQARGCQALSAP
jgi:hypothetical protein